MSISGSHIDDMALEIKRNEEETIPKNIRGTFT